MEPKKIGAGIIAIDKKTGDVLLGRRSSHSSSPETWCPFGGTHEPLKDSSMKITAKREFIEETGLHQEIEYKISKTPFYTQDSPTLTFYTYIGIFDSKFPVIIDDEHIDYGWFQLDNLPDTLHPGFEDLLLNKKTELEEIIRKILNVTHKIINK